MSEDKGLADLVRDVVDRSATGAEELHRTIASFPLEVLERIGLFEASAAQVKEIQSESIRAVYDLVRDINQRVARFTSGILQ